MRNRQYGNLINGKVNQSNMEGAQCFIEVYKCMNETFLSPDFSEDHTYVSLIDNLKNDLEFNKQIGIQTIAVWYIKPNTKYLKTSNQ